MNKKALSRIRRHGRVRSKIEGTSERPRLCVFRSNAQIYAQVIDDTTWKTLCSASSLKIVSGTKTEKAKLIWKEIAEKAIALKIKTIVFDRWGFTYTGRVSALADSAREAGLKF